MTNKKRIFPIIALLILGFCFLNLSMIWAQPRTHVVQKGDTLWDICEKYYGDPNLWPKLWQMNPFVTNPHLLEPGDVITLLEDVPLKKEVEEKKVPAVKPIEPVPLEAGVNVASVTRLTGLGYLSSRKIEPWGYIMASKSERTLLETGETVYIKFNGGDTIKPGEEFSIFRPSPLIKHPVTGQNLGYVISVRGKLVAQEPVGLGFREGQFYDKEGIYKAKIVDSFELISVGDPLLPYESLSPCVQAVSMDQEIIGNIVAAKDNLELLATGSVVYIDQGFNQGVHRGNLFQVVKVHLVPDPDIKQEVLTMKPLIILPDVPIGVLMVVESRPETATAVVISADGEFATGSYIKGISFVEAPELIKRIPTCPME